MGYNFRNRLETGKGGGGGVRSMEELMDAIRLRSDKFLQMGLALFSMTRIQMQRCEAADNCGAVEWPGSSAANCAPDIRGERCPFRDSGRAGKNGREVLGP